jgi:uncharacterized protein YjbJ (UPF0337 family)
MAEQGKSGQARKGLVDSVKGKAKEVVGAIIGNDSLTAEGQLDQTQAHERKEANAIDAVAESEVRQARAEESETKVEGIQERSPAGDPDARGVPGRPTGRRDQTDSGRNGCPA